MRTTETISLPARVRDNKRIDIAKGQCLRLVGIDEDLSFYEGAGAGPDMAKVKEAVKRL